MDPPPVFFFYFFAPKFNVLAPEGGWGEGGLLSAARLSPVQSPHTLSYLLYLPCRVLLTFTPPPPGYRVAYPSAALLYVAAKRRLSCSAQLRPAACRVADTAALPPPPSPPPPRPLSRKICSPGIDLPLPLPFSWQHRYTAHTA
jgi:hypothetical protein